MKSYKWLSKENLIKGLTIFCLLMIVGNASCFGISPFVISVAFSIIYCGFNGIYVCFCTFLALIIHNITFAGIIDASLVVATLFILWLTKLGKKGKVYFLLLFFAFSRLANIYFSFYSIESLIKSMLDVFLGMLVCYFAYKVCYAYSTRNIHCWTTCEKACAVVMLVIVFIGFSNLCIYQLSISKLIFIFLILFMSKTKAKSISIGLLIGIAQFLVNLDLSMLGLFCLMAAISSYLTPKNKLLSASFVCLADSVIGLLSNYTLISLIPCLIASLIFVALPNKVYVIFSDYFFGSEKSLISNYYITKKQQSLHNKLLSMSSLFKELQKCYRNLLISDSNKSNIVNTLANEAKLKCCESCINKINCYNGKDMTPCFCEIIERAIKKGKINILDIPNLLSSNCTKLNSCISIINALSQEYNEEVKKSKSADDSKLNIALQLGGTSTIFKELSNSFISTNKTNTKKSKRIKDKVCELGVVCRECVVTEDYLGVNEILFAVRNSDAVNPNLIKACQSIYPIKFERKDCYQTKVAGWSIVVLAPLARYELLCGFASTPKIAGDISGDNYVYTKLTDSKYLLAICDGMGHGDNANKVSSIAINLIENYYKSGLSSQVVLDSVNNLLLPAGDEYTTLDATIVDTSNGQVDFIKMGSTISIVKGVEQSEIVNVESLPLGVIDGIVPTTTTKVLSSGDIVVLVSDGIADMFASPEEFCNFVNNERVINMQTFAENLLEEALSRVKDKKDDMSVVAYRLVQKR